MLERFLKNTGYLTEEGLVGFTTAHFEDESESAVHADVPGFPFLYTQKQVTLPGSNEALIPDNEVARDDTYIYYDTLTKESPKGNEVYTFSELTKELGESIQKRNLPHDPTLCANALASVVRNLGNPCTKDPDETEKQQEQLQNGLRQAWEVIHKKMEERERQEQRMRENTELREDLLDTIRFQAEVIHGDRLLLSLEEQGIDVSFSLDKKDISREEAQKNFLTFYKLIRKMYANGTFIQPTDEEQKIAYETAKNIDDLDIYLKKRKKDGTEHIQSLSSLCRNLHPDEKNYIKYAFFSSKDKVEFKDVKTLRAWYEKNKEKLIKDEMHALTMGALVCGRRIGAPTKDPTGRTKPWSQLVPNLERSIPGYTHTDHIPFRLDLYLTFLTRAGYLIYSKESKKDYTVHDIMNMNKLPKGLYFYSTSSGERYTLSSILRNCGELRATHTDTKAFAADEESFYEYWAQEFEGAKSLANVQNRNRERIEEAYVQASYDTTQADLYREMQLRRLYEEQWIQNRLNENNRRETEAMVTGEYIIEPKMDTFANAMCSLCGIQDFSKYTGVCILYENNEVEVKEVRESTPDPYILAQRLGDITNEPRQYTSMGEYLTKFAPPIFTGANIAIAKLREEVTSELTNDDMRLQTFMDRLKDQDFRKEQELLYPDGSQQSSRAGVYG